MTRRFPLSTAGQAAANLYAAGAGVRAWVYRAGWLPQKRLGAKVISIGNITWGGTGKTPFTIWLAKQLAGSGMRASILTRGYGRISTDPVRLFFPGASAADARLDGDEVQLYLRHRVMAAIGIADSRYLAGRAIESRFRIDVHLLDDGFQHLSVARNLDMVLIDAANPWGSRNGFSRLLRESPRALRRAHAILITNTTEAANGRGDLVSAVKMTVQKLNPRVPIFTASTRLVRFTDPRGARSFSIEQMRPTRPAAFCGLASPANFFNLLTASGIQAVATEIFPDHHRYSAADVQRIDGLAESGNANCLLTTEKDLVNLPDDCKFKLPLYWAEVEMVIADPQTLMQWLRERLDGRA